MKKKMSILFLLAVALSLVSSTATADTATFLERETYNLDGWFDYWRYHDFDGTTYAQYADSRSNDPSEWRAKTGAALAFAVLFRRTNNNAAAFEAQELLWRVYWSTYESGSPGERLKPEHGTCDAFDRGARAQALLDWLVAYMLLHTNDESPYTPYLWNPVPEWDEVLINLADKWKDAAPCEGTYVPPPYVNLRETDAEENAPAAAFLAIMSAAYPGNMNASAWYSAANTYGFHTSTYLREDGSGQMCGYGFCSVQLHETSPVPPYYWWNGLGAGNGGYPGQPTGYTSTPRYGLYAIGQRGVGTVVHKRVTGYWGSGELDRNVKWYWFPWHWPETGFAEGYNDWRDAQEFTCDRGALVEERDFSGVRADLTSAMAAAYHDARWNTAYTDEIVPFLPQSKSQFVAPLDEVVGICPQRGGGTMALREHSEYSGNFSKQFIFDSALMKRVGYAVIAKDSGMEIDPIE